VLVPAGVWLANGILAALAVVFLVQALRGNVFGHSFDRARIPWWSALASRLAERRRRSQPVRSSAATAAAGVSVAPFGIRPKDRALPRYVAGRYFRLAMLTFTVLFVAYLLIDVMERLDWFARYHASASEIVRFYGARVPLLVSRVFPMSLLVATAMTVSLLAVEGELIGMRACGIPAPRALLPVLALSLLSVFAYFALNNVVVPRTNALADALKETEIKKGYHEAKREKQTNAVWYRSGDRVLAADRFDPDRGLARNLALYKIGADGLPVSRLDAVSARHIGNGEWRLDEPRLISVEDGMVRESPAPRYATLGDALPAKVDTMHLSIAALTREIAQMEADGYDSTAYRVDRQVKLAEPLACLILPALVLFFAVGGPPFPGPAQNLLVSGIVGVGYILISGVSTSFGYGGTVAPAVGGWFPNILCSLAAGYFGLRLWRRS
jgi:lipopolysaccharide export system permease protein